MIKRREERRLDIREQLKGGKGNTTLSHIFEKEELFGKANMFAEGSLSKGESIGVHSHNEEGEIYIIMSGTATVTDNGKEYELNVGDAMWTTRGGTHSIENRCDEKLVFYAIILP